MASRVLEAALDFCERGCAVIPVPYRKKGPVIKGWNKLSLSVDQIPEYFNKSKLNIGLILGSVSGKIYDVDCDCLEAVAAARRLLPNTSVFGRVSNPLSHWLYEVKQEMPKNLCLKDTDGEVLVELRGDGLQTVVPPSVHEYGEPIEWETDLDTLHLYDNGRELMEDVYHIAAIALLARNYPNSGSRNNFCLALAGVLLLHGIDEAIAIRFVRITAKIAGDDEWKSRGACVRSTQERITNSQPVCGIPTLKEHVNQAVIDKLCDWMHLDSVSHEEECRQSSNQTPKSDVSNAEWFCDMFADDVRFNVDTNNWHLWRGRAWVVDSKGKIQDKAEAAVKDMYDLLPSMDEKQRKEFLKHITRSESLPRLQAMLKMASRKGAIPVCDSEFDADPMLFNVRNCTIDLRTGQPNPHTRDNLISLVAPVKYDENAECPLFRQFLLDVFQGNADTIAYVLRVAGYWLTGITDEEAFWVFLGKAQSGKSKFLSVLTGIMGPYAGSAAMSTFTEKREMNSYDLATLAGKRLVIASEASDSDAFNESMLKSITGRDSVKCRPIYGRPIEYDPKFKIAIATNEMPKLKSQGYDMRRRLKIVPFRQRFHDPEDGKKPVKDKDILRKLLREKSGILNLLIEGCLEWQCKGLQVPDHLVNERDTVFEDQDPLADFLKTYCIVDPTAKTPVAHIWKSYQSWLVCADVNPQNAYRQPQGLSRDLVRRDGFEHSRTNTGAKALMGIRLNHDIDEFD